MTVNLPLLTRSSFVKLCFATLLTAGLAGGVGLPVLAGDGKAPDATLKVPAVFDKAVPASVQELRDMQDHVTRLMKMIAPATVNLKIGQAQGSGVIISEDGFVLTAGHVSGGKANVKCKVTMPDGKVLDGETLGRNATIDSGLVKITTPGKYAFVAMGDSAKLKKGQWVVATGHPGGWKQGRPPVLRLGRVIDPGTSAIRTDCTLVGGDSGGPLFDMEGKVVGIHSRIANSVTQNIHVPVDTYRETWDRLAQGDIWGSGIGGGPGGGGGKAAATPAYLGIKADEDDKDCRIAAIAEGSPAEIAGLKIDDVVTRFNDNAIQTFADLLRQVNNRKAGEVVSLEIRRGDEFMTLKIKLGKRPS